MAPFITIGIQKDFIKANTNNFKCTHTFPFFHTNNSVIYIAAK